MERNDLLNEIIASSATAYERESSPQPASVSYQNTDLAAPYKAGNFNFSYKGGSDEAVVTFKAFLRFRNGIEQPEKDKFRRVLKDSVSCWDRAAQLEIKDNTGAYSKKIVLRFQLAEVSKKEEANKVIDVYKEGKRLVPFFPKDVLGVVARQVNVHADIDVKTMAHELGHVWGALDEYNRSFKSVGHVGRKSPLLKDTSALMHDGDEFRVRYFTHFGRAILKVFFNLEKYRRPVIINKTPVATAINGRISLLKRDISGALPYSTDQQFNPRFTTIQVARRR
ncbi:MAG: hypothetical protein WA004_05595 [Saprospiraceae bacterium]